MTSHYEVLRPVVPADLDTRPRFVEVLKLIPPDGHVTFERFRHLGKTRASKGLAHARSIGIIKESSPHERVLNLDSVKFWCAQLNESSFKHTAPRNSTLRLYLRLLTRFDEWLQNRPFPSHGTVRSGTQSAREGMTKSFANVEKLMEYCDVSEHGTRTAQRMVREYLVSLRAGGASDSVRMTTRSAIKSFFGVHDIPLDLCRIRKKRPESTPSDDPLMTLGDFYKMLQNGKPNILMRTAMLVMFQSGMDSSTFTERFNYEGYPQIAKHFKTEDHSMWDLDTCPVPIKLIRVKTNVRYTTFLDRDAVAQLQEYLTWKEVKYGRHDASKPLFQTKQGTPIHSSWISVRFSEVAVRAGIQEKVSKRAYRMRAHNVRHLLKSTLLASGCARYAADHVLGHAPWDTYERQVMLYPKELRTEYTKASSRINVISRVEDNLNSLEDTTNQDARIRELEAEVAALKQSKTECGLIEMRHKNSMNEMYEKIKRLVYLLDSLPNDVKETMAGKLKDADDADWDFYRNPARIPCQ